MTQLIHHEGTKDTEGEQQEDRKQKKKEKKEKKKLFLVPMNSSVSFGPSW